VEYDIDYTAVQPGINFNFYTISPAGIGAGGFNQNIYCDGAFDTPRHCMELDFLEGAGNCGFAATIHTKVEKTSNGCTSWGCRTDITFNGQTRFHMKVDFGTDGSMTWNVAGRSFPSAGMDPAPDGQAMGMIRSELAAHGGVLYSSMWGHAGECWTPLEQQCGNCADQVQGYSSLQRSVGRVSNLKVMGSVVQGPPPHTCGGASPSPPTPWAPAPPTGGQGQPCRGGVCCDPQLGQRCPGGLACPSCGGPACQCPGQDVEDVAEEILV